MGNRVLLAIIGMSAFVATVAIGVLLVGGDSADDVVQSVSVTAQPVVTTSETAPTTSSVTTTSNAPVVTDAPIVTNTEPPVTEPPRPVVNCVGGYNEREVLPLMPCNKGFSVELLQQFLNEWDYYVDIDGYYGQSTADVVYDFQSDNGLPATGEVDAETWGQIAGARPGVDINGDGVIGPNEIIYD